MKEKDAFDEFIGKMFEIEPIDRILLQILRRNPHIKASFNKELGVWVFYGKKGEQFLPSNTCTYENRQLFILLLIRSVFVRAQIFLKKFVCIAFIV